MIATLGTMLADTPEQTADTTTLRRLIFDVQPGRLSLVFSERCACMQYSSMDSRVIVPTTKGQSNLRA